MVGYEVEKAARAVERRGVAAIAILEGRAMRDERWEGESIGWRRVDKRGGGGEEEAGDEADERSGGETGSSRLTLKVMWLAVELKGGRELQVRTHLS